MEIDIRHILAPPGDTFQAMIACATEEVKHAHILKVNPVLQDIVKSLFGKIRSWPGWPVICGRFDSPPL